MRLNCFVCSEFLNYALDQCSCCRMPSVCDSWLQVLAGDVEEAICTHAFFYAIWRKYGVLPERFNMDSKQPNVLFYPLRPELAESTYLLYQATKNPFYLHVGTQLLQDLEQNTKARWVGPLASGRASVPVGEGNDTPAVVVCPVVVAMLLCTMCWICLWRTEWRVSSSVKHASTSTL